MKKRFCLTLAAILMMTGLAFSQGGQTTVIRNGASLPTVCQGGDIFMKSGTLYFNNTASAGACSWVSSGSSSASFSSLTAGTNNSAAMVVGIGGSMAFTEQAPTFPSSEATPTAPTAALVASGGNCTAGSHVFAVSEITAYGQTIAGPTSGAVTCDGSHKQVTVGSIATGSAAVTGRNIWASLANATSPLYLVSATSPVIGDNTTTSYTFNVSDATMSGIAIQSPQVNSTSGGSGSGSVVMQNQPVVNALSLNQYAGVPTPAAPTLADITGSGSLIANTTYMYACFYYNNVGPSAFGATQTITTASDAGPHKVQVTCPTNSSTLGYAIWGRANNSTQILYIVACTGAGVPVSQCTSANVFVDDGTITPVPSTQAFQALNNSNGIGFGPPTGSPTGAYSNPTLNDTFITRYSGGILLVTASNDSAAVICFGPTFNAYACIGQGTGVGGMELQSSGPPIFRNGFSTLANSSVTGTFGVSSVSTSGVRTAVLSNGNATATCDLSLGNQCWIKPVGATNITTLTVTNLVANGSGFDFCVTEDGTGGASVTFASSPFHGSWSPTTTANNTSCAHYASPSGTSLYLAGYTNGQT